MTLDGKKVVVVGGSSGIGLSAAKFALQAGADVTICSRSLNKLETARDGLAGKPDIQVIDSSDEQSVSDAFAAFGQVDHVVFSAPGALFGAVKNMDIREAQNGLNTKFWGSVRVAKYAQIASTGSLTFVSGQMARRPIKNFLAGAAANASVDILARGLAVELAPIRVNSVSPGFVDTPLHSRMPREEIERRITEAENTLPVGRVGQADDIGMMILQIMQNGFLTGSVIEIDGGRAAL